MKSNAKAAIKVFGIGIFAGFLAFFIYLSLFTIFDRLARSVDGYEVYQATEDGGYYVAETHYFADNETIALPKTEQGQKATFIRSEMPAPAKAVMNMLMVICCTGTYLTFVGSEVAKVAVDDQNKVQFKEAKANRKRGLWIGLLASVPSFVLYAGVIICKLLNIQSYTMWLYLNMPLKPIIDLITGDAVRMDQVTLPTLIFCGLPLLLAPVFCFVIYLLGLDDSALFKIIYKTKSKDDRKGAR